MEVPCREKKPVPGRGQSGLAPGNDLDWRSEARPGSRGVRMGHEDVLKKGSPPLK